MAVLLAIVHLLPYDPGLELTELHILSLLNAGIQGMCATMLGHALSCGSGAKGRGVDSEQVPGLLLLRCRRTGECGQ